MLTAAELITLIKAHNKLVSIKVSASMKRETLIKLIEGKGYKVDHKNKKIVDARKDRPRRPKITLKEAQDMLPKPKTALQKQKAVERKEEKAAEEKKKLRMAKKEAVEQSKKGTKKDKDIKPKSILKTKVRNNKKEESMGDTAFIKQQKKLQLEKQKETRRALLKQNVKVDKTTRRGKPVKKEEPKKNMDTKNNSPLFVVGKKYGTEQDTFKDDDKSNKKNKIVIKVIKRTKKFITFTKGDDDEPIRRSIQSDDDGDGEYLPYPFKINAKRDLIKD